MGWGGGGGLHLLSEARLSPTGSECVGPLNVLSETSADPEPSAWICEAVLDENRRRHHRQWGSGGVPWWPSGFAFGSSEATPEIVQATKCIILMLEFMEVVAFTRDG